MSSLWTPSGEHFPKEEGGGAADPPPGRPGDTDVTPPSQDVPLTEEQAAAQAEVDAMRAQLAHTPAEVVVANHCYGLFELAAIYLSQTPPQLFQARLAIVTVQRNAGTRASIRYVAQQAPSTPRSNEALCAARKSAPSNHGSILGHRAPKSPAPATCLQVRPWI